MAYLRHSDEAKKDLTKGDLAIWRNGVSNRKAGAAMKNNKRGILARKHGVSAYRARNSVMLAAKYHGGWRSDIGIAAAITATYRLRHRRK